MSPRDLDRLAAAKAADLAAARRRATDAARSAKQAQIDGLEARVAALVPHVLARVQQLDQRRIIQVKVSVGRRGVGRFLPDRTAVVGAVHLFGYPRPGVTGPGIAPLPVALASDGSIVVGAGSHTVGEYAALVADHEGIGRSGNWTPTRPFSLDGFRLLAAELEALADGPADT
ncbi:MAG TPA: hypothetical protein VNA20_01880 [Frankiaceae bacterium]|nr:hypothetical protein [Frankiaceae bacterium]